LAGGLAFSGGFDITGFRPAQMKDLRIHILDKTRYTSK
jgi:hypothetical protein